MKRIIFVLTFTSCFLLILACQENSDNMPKYSLAQWSFNRELFAGEMNTFDFIRAAAELKFEGVEYVSQFFQDKVEDLEFLDSIHLVAQQSGIKNLLIMVDGAGDLGDADPSAQMRAIVAHQQWVLAAKRIGCSSIRVNAHGSGGPETLKTNCVRGIKALAQYGEKHGVQILIENHGGLSNDGAWLADLLTQLSANDVAALADFDNWCIERENGQLWGAPCTQRYDRYKGLQELMPFAKALSVKSFDFDETGNETTMDYARIFEIVQAANYEGYLGIEYEGDQLPSREGIAKTRALVEKVWKN